MLMRNTQGGVGQLVQLHKAASRLTITITGVMGVQCTDQCPHTRGGGGVYITVGVVGERSSHHGGLN